MEISSNIINAQIQNVQSPTVATVGIQGPPGPPGVDGTSGVLDLTTTGAGAATLVGGILNIPTPTGSGAGGVVTAKNLQLDYGAVPVPLQNYTGSGTPNATQSGAYNMTSQSFMAMALNNTVALAKALTYCANNGVSLFVPDGVFWYYNSPNDTFYTPLNTSLGGGHGCDPLVIWTSKSFSIFGNGLSSCLMSIGSNGIKVLSTNGDSCLDVHDIWMPPGQIPFPYTTLSQYTANYHSNYVGTNYAIWFENLYPYVASQGQRKATQLPIIVLSSSGTTATATLAYPHALSIIGGLMTISGCDVSGFNLSILAMPLINSFTQSAGSSAYTIYQSVYTGIAANYSNTLAVFKTNATINSGMVQFVGNAMPAFSTLNAGDTLLYVADPYTITYTVASGLAAPMVLGVVTHANYGSGSNKTFRLSNVSFNPDYDPLNKDHQPDASFCYYKEFIHVKNSPNAKIENIEGAGLLNSTPASISWKMAYAINSDNQNTGMMANNLYHTGCDTVYYAGSTDFSRITALTYNNTTGVVTVAYSGPGHFLNTATGVPKTYKVIATGFAQSGYNDQSGTVILTVVNAATLSYQLGAGLSLSSVNDTSSTGAFAYSSFGDIKTINKITGDLYIDIGASGSHLWWRIGSPYADWSEGLFIDNLVSAAINHSIVIDHPMGQPSHVFTNINGNHYADGIMITKTAGGSIDNVTLSKEPSTSNDFNAIYFGSTSNTCLSNIQGAGSSTDNAHTDIVINLDSYTEIQISYTSAANDLVKRVASGCSFNFFNQIDAVSVNYVFKFGQLTATNTIREYSNGNRKTTNQAILDNASNNNVVLSTWANRFATVSVASAAVSIPASAWTAIPWDTSTDGGVNFPDAFTDFINVTSTLYSGGTLTATCADYHNLTDGQYVFVYNSGLYQITATPTSYSFTFSAAATIPSTAIFIFAGKIISFSPASITVTSTITITVDSGYVLTSKATTVYIAYMNSSGGYLGKYVFKATFLSANSFSVLMGVAAFNTIFAAGNTQCVYQPTALTIPNNHLLQLSVQASVLWDVAASGTAEIALVKNGTNVVAESGQLALSSTSQLIQQLTSPLFTGSALDIYELWAYQTCTAAVNIINNGGGSLPGSAIKRNGTYMTLSQSQFG